MAAYADQYTPQQLYAWQHRSLFRLFTQRYKMNMQSIDTTKVGAVAPGAHDFTKIPSDIKPDIWLENLRGVPDEYKN